LKQKDDNYVSTWEPSSVKMTVTAKPNEVTQSQGQQLIAARGEDAVSVMKPSPENLDPDLEGAAAEYPAMVERAKEAGFSVRDANTARGIYSGPIINAGQHYVVQDAGMRTAVIHSREHVGTAIAVGEHVRATYSAGICAITRRDAPSLTR
jgi:hypothetical protein